MKSISVIAAALGGAGVFGAPALVAREPPGIPSESVARSMLGNLTVGSYGSDDKYDRDLFKHWINVEDGCTARQMVLKRDGNNVKVDDSCQPTSGSWLSPFDGETETEVSEVSIDHMVPLSNAWHTGADKWSNSRREDFANDLDGPQLWAVTASINSEKSDSSPDKWAPPVTSFRCTYARSWVQVKSTWELRITSAEKTALDTMLDSC